MTEVVARQQEHVLATWSAQRTVHPQEIVGGQGSRYQTADGAWWWDLGSTTWNAHLGHAHPVMQQRLAEAAGRGLVAGPNAAFPDKARAGELLAQIAPAGLTRSFLCLSGAEANENAVKMARMITGRSHIVTRSRSYHGATLAMLSLSGDPRREPFEPGYPGVHRMANPYCYRCAFGLEPQSCARECAEDLERAILEAGPGQVAAVLLEGMTGANGAFPPPPGYYRKVREICDRHGVLWIADEVLSGFGRTGRWFAVDHDGAIPDMITCAKGLTAGYAPGGAVLLRDSLARHFDDHVLLCGLTAYAHPLMCSAVCAAIDVMQAENLPERAAQLGHWLAPRLPQLHPAVGEARGLGLLWGLELVHPGTRDPWPIPASLTQALARRHLHMHKRDNWLYLAPPLIITEAELEECLGLLKDALQEGLTV